jgi:bifunctional DNA-binding transcriptional regulator/antitoxin component of YhaV-PrlF toxin-antitoxin module
MEKVVIERIDPQGRIVLPTSLRELAKSGEVVLVNLGETIIYPRESSLLKYVNSLEVDVKFFGDYHKLRRGVGKFEVS